jgi:sigma-54-dependent transcriptional regulator
LVKHVPPQKDIIDWFEGLFESQDIRSAAKVLAAALGDVSAGGASGVFLLDETKSQLLLFASWTAAGGGKIEAFQPVSITEVNDPLCFSLQRGTFYQADLNPTATMILLHAGPSNVFAMPLKSRITGSIGGVLVTTGYGNPIKAIAPLQMIGLYAASLIENMILKKTETSIIGALRSDITWLEKRKQQERELAATRIIGTSEAISHVRGLIIKAAPTNASVLITGETGTGKELTAEAIHSLSPRKNAPFMKMNCGAISPFLLESELFGHVKGAFTGADSDHPGLLRGADKGSVLLDEIGDMPIQLQVKLLRVLQDQKVRPVGDVKDYPVDIRIIATTNKNLQAAIQQGEFRKDLYHRLAALHIHIPPLRERRQDIPVLAAHFFEKLCRRHGREGLTLPLEAFMHLGSLPLPGNARELTNEIERIILFSDDSKGDLSFDAAPEDRAFGNGKKHNLVTLLGEYELDLIERSLRQFGGNMSRAARALGIPRTTLCSKLQKTSFNASDTRRK